MSVRRSAYISVGARNAGILIHFVAAMVIARLLTPSEIGVFAVGAAFVTIIQVMRESGISSYLIQERELTPERLGTAMGISLLSGVLLGAGIFALAGPIAQFYEEPGVREVLRILACSMVLVPANAVGLALLRRQLAFGTCFFIETASNLVWAVVAVLLAWRGVSYYSLAWASVASTITLFGAILLLRRSAVLIKPALSEWRRVFGFGSMVTLTQFVSQFGTLAPTLLLGRLADFGSVAMYTRGNSLTRTFQQSVERGVAIVALPAFAAQLRRGEFSKANYCHSASLMTAISWPFFCVLAIMAYPIVRILFGAQWDAAVPVVRLLALAHMFRAPVAIAPELTTAYGAVRIGLVRELALQGVRVAMVVLCAPHGFIAVAVGQIGVTATSLVANQIILKRLIGLGASELAAACARSLAVTVVAAACPLVSFLVYPAAPDRLWGPLLAGAAAATIGWLVAVVAFDHPVRVELTLILRKLRSLKGQRA